MRRGLAALACAALLAMAPAAAHVGHDHGETSQRAATAAPRIEAHSEDYELLGALNGTRLRIWLDRFASNEPVAGARLAVESGSFKADARELEPGVYEVDLGTLAQPGRLPLIFAVFAKPADDLLEGELEIPAVAPAAPAARARTAPWTVLGVAAIASLLVVTLAAWLMRKGAKR